MVERHERHILHENLSGLLQQGDTFLVVTCFLLFLDEFVELRVAIIASLGGACAKILVVKRIGIN